MLDHLTVVGTISQWHCHLSACVRAHDGHHEYIFCCFMVQCVKLMLRIFQSGLLLFDCFVYHQNVTCLKRFTRYGYYTGETKEIIIGRLAVVS